MAAPKAISEKAFVAAIRSSGGVTSVIAEKLDCTTQNVGIRIRASKRLQEVLKEVDDKLIDMCEVGFIKAIQDGDLNVMRWYAEKKGKSRGYGNKVENSINHAQLEAFLVSLGGDPSKYRAALIAFGVDPDEG